MDERRGTKFLLAAVLALAVAFSAAPAFAGPWLLISDVHYDPRNTSPLAAHVGQDTNDALLRSALAAAVAVDPDPPVVVVSGDLLAHNFPPGALAGETMTALAQRFDDVFPRAQFVLALGNNDSACGDYETTPHDTFLATVATAWEPLVDRGGAAPSFRTTFPRYAGYAARLPFGRVVVADDTFWSRKYRDACDPTAASGEASFAEFAAALAAPAPVATWVVLHIPPGVDAFSALGGAPPAPFLRDDAQAAFTRAVEAPQADVALVLTAHIHRFAFRVTSTGATGRPVLIAPAISPIYGNAPAFATLDVGADGTLAGATEYAYRGGGWQRAGSFADLGIAPFSAPQLLAASSRLHAAAAGDRLWMRFFALYDGGATIPPEVAGSAAIGCAAIALTPAAFAACVGAP